MPGEPNDASLSVNKAAVLTAQLRKGPFRAQSRDNVENESSSMMMERSESWQF